jgi:cysteine-rich repeat protein
MIEARVERRWGGSIALTLLLAAALPAGRAVAACGNGTREGAEQCDGSDRGGYTCDDFCGSGGTLGCKADCTFDLANCHVCGNGTRDPGEACDCDAPPCTSAQLGGAVCPQGGILGCVSDCSQLDMTDCYFCGNGEREGPELTPPGTEACDGGDLGGATCPPPTYHGGTPLCLGDCTLDFDTTAGTQGGCWRCGNGRVEPGEECDGGALNGTGSYGCTATCTTRCGDGVVQSNETCDDNNRIDGDGCSSLCRIEQQYPGGGSEPVDCNLEWGVVGVDPGPSVPCADGDLACDRDGLADGTCTFAVGYCFNVYPGRPENPSCTPTNVARYELWGTSLTGAGALDAATQTAVLDALRATIVLVPGLTVTPAGPVRTVTPPLLDLNLCGSLTLAVPAGGTRDLAFRATDSGGAPDQDQMSFTCM